MGGLRLNVIDMAANDADGCILFDTINYTLSDCGVHRYTTREIAGNDDKITYDDTVRIVNVTVTDNGDGTLGCVAECDWQ